MYKKSLKIALGAIAVLTLVGCTGQKNITLDELKKDNSFSSLKVKKYELSNKQKELRESKKFESMVFFDKYSFNDDKYLKMCVQSCNKYSLNKNGYKYLEEAINDGWELYTKMEDLEVNISNDCACSGKNVLVKRK